MKDNWPRVNAITLDYEGGNDDDPNDPGGRTSRGITQREYNVWLRSHIGLPTDVWKAPQATIVAIYAQEYWAPVHGDDWYWGMDLCVYDLGVNSGIGRALQFARSTMGTPNASLAAMALASSAVVDKSGWIKRYQARRLSFLHNLRTWSYFGRGWGRRVAGIESLALGMLARAQGQSVAGTLNGEAVKARQKQLTAGGASTASTAGAGAHAGAVDWVTWWDIALNGAVLIAALVLIAYLLHTWRVQGLRAEAFGKAATNGPVPNPH